MSDLKLCCICDKPFELEDDTEKMEAKTVWKFTGDLNKQSFDRPLPVCDDCYYSYYQCGKCGAYIDPSAKEESFVTVQVFDAIVSFCPDEAEAIDTMLRDFTE